MPHRMRFTEGDTTWTAEVEAGGQVSVREQPGAGPARLTSAGAPAIVQVDASASPGDARSRARLLAATSDDARVAGVVAEGRDAIWVQIGPEVFEFRPWQSASADRAGALTPPMSATVVRIAVHVGDTVRQGDLLIALEAMKMELPIRAPRDGVVRAVHCREGDLVQPGTTLIEM